MLRYLCSILRPRRQGQASVLCGQEKTHMESSDGQRGQQGHGMTETGTPTHTVTGISWPLVWSRSLALAEVGKRYGECLNVCPSLQNRAAPAMTRKVLPCRLSPCATVLRCPAASSPIEARVRACLQQSLCVRAPDRKVWPTHL